MEMLSSSDDLRKIKDLLSAKLNRSVSALAVTFFDDSEGEREALADFRLGTGRDVGGERLSLFGLHAPIRRIVDSHAEKLTVRLRPSVR